MRAGRRGISSPCKGRCPRMIFLRKFMLPRDIFDKKMRRRLSVLKGGNMAELLIVWHSRTNGSRQMAEAAYAAACLEGPARLLPAIDAEPGDLMGAAGYLFCAPENLASLSGQMKEFFDRCYYPVLGQIEGRPYAQMICAGSDGQGAARQLARIATGWRLREVQPPLIVCTYAQAEADILAEKHLTKGQLTPCAELGAALSAGLSLGVF